MTPTLDVSTIASIPFAMRHHTTSILQSLPDWLHQAPQKLYADLSELKPELPDWFNTISAPQHAALREAQTDSWSARSRVENILKNVLDVHAFAEPLLKERLKADYGLDIDPKEIFINLYTQSTLPVLDVPTAGSTAWRVSLLDAALHNFEAFEAQDLAFTRDSGFISRPDKYNNYRTLNNLTAQISIPSFVKLCRTLDLGQRYKEHLLTELGFNDRGVQQLLNQEIIESHRTELKAALHQSLARKDIKDATFQSFDAYLKGGNNAWATQTMTLLDCDLTGPLIFTPQPGDTTITSVVVYLPHDPIQPLKEYTTLTDFIAYVAKQLINEAYLTFFSRFVNHDQIGTFYGALETSLYHIILYRPEGPGFAPAVETFTTKKIPKENPTLNYSTTEIDNRNNEALLSKLVEKIFRDAKTIAVSTESADRKTRERHWEKLKSIGEAVFNAALFVIAPFVPVVGELMLLQMAYQLLDDTYEGIRDWAKGKPAEAFDHFFNILSSVAQAVLFGATTVILKPLLSKASAFIKGLKAVKSADGKTRLWSPDITPYAHDLSIPEGSKPNELGLHEHEGKTLLKLTDIDDKEHTLVVNKAEDRDVYTLQHATRPEAFAPQMEHNGQGAWSMEGEEPQTWNGNVLMRRLGHITEGLSNNELEAIRSVSGTDEGTLRKIHTVKDTIPPLLEDSFKRFKTHKTMLRDIEHIRNGELLETKSNWLDSMATELEGWPKEKAIKVHRDAAHTDLAHTFGNANASPEDSITLTHDEVKAGKLPSLIADNFSEEHLSTLLGAPTSKELAQQKIQIRLADHAAAYKKNIFEYEYSHTLIKNDPHLALIKDTYPTLPDPVAQALLKTSTPEEALHLSEKKTLPIRIEQVAKALDLNTQIMHAQEGAHVDTMLNAAGEKLAINTLRIHSDSISDLHLEVRDGALDGEVRHAHQPSGATQKRIIVRTGDSRYEVREADNTLVHPADNFHNALAKALPVKNRQKLYAQFSKNQTLKGWLSEKQQPPAELITALSSKDIAYSARRESEQLLKGGLLTYFARPEPTIENPHTSFVRELYPTRSKEEVELIANRINTPELKSKLEALIDEKDLLFKELGDWVGELEFRASPGKNLGSIKEGRRQIRALIEKAWLAADKPEINMAGTSHANGTLSLDNTDLGALFVDKLTLSKPLTLFTEVTLDSCKLDSKSTSFLKNFPNARTLSARHNNLNNLPSELFSLPKLKTLDLSHNKIELPPTSSSLPGLKQLKFLDLSSNPLKRPPDVSLMRNLQTLRLNNTAIETWPNGLFSLKRPDNFDLRLTGNKITTIPEYPLNSQQSKVIARARLDIAKLDTDSKDLFENYRRALGLDPHRTYPPRGAEGRRFWLEEAGEFTPDVIKEMAHMWDKLEEAHGSQGFFEVIDRLAITDPEIFNTDADAEAYDDDLDILRDKVWRVMDAAYDDPQMREKLFTIASAPTDCADAGAHIFKTMGMETLIYEAKLAFAEGELTRLDYQKQMAQLAIGQARLTKLYEIASSDIAQRILPTDQGGEGLRFTSDQNRGTLDEVEVHMAYQARLAESLELPWVSKYMAYRDVAAVNNTKITNAYRIITEGEANNGLVEQLVEIPFWQELLNEQYAAEMRANEEVFGEKSEALDGLSELQRQWVQSSADISQRDVQRLNQLKALATQLSADPDLLLTQDRMKDSTYLKIVDNLAYEQKGKSRELTNNVLRQAGLLPRAATE